MSFANLGWFVLGIATIIAVLMVWAGRRDGGWRKALRHFLFYGIDVTAAVAGLTLGFGLEVRSWPWLIGIFLVSRFCIHMMQSAFYLDEAKKRLASVEQQPHQGD